METLNKALESYGLKHTSVLVYDKTLTATDDSYNIAGNDVLAVPFPVLHKKRVEELKTFRNYNQYPPVEIKKTKSKGYGVFA